MTSERSSRPREAGGTSVSEPRKVLLVEDDESLAILEADVLERRGFEVETVALGRLALERLPLGGLSLMVLDYRLPDMTGADVVAAMGDAIAELPVVVVTGYPDPAVEERMRAAGVYDYFVKEMDLKFLDDLPEAAVAAVSGRPRYRR